jgi:hypothetical protein
MISAELHVEFGLIFTILTIVAKKMMPTMKQMCKLRRVRFSVNLLETRFIQMAGNQGSSSATAKMTAAVNMMVAEAAVTHKPTVLN